MSEGQKEITKSIQMDIKLLKIMGQGLMEAIYVLNDQQNDKEFDGLVLCFRHFQHTLGQMENRNIDSFFVDQATKLVKFGEDSIMFDTVLSINQEEIKLGVKESKRNISSLSLKSNAWNRSFWIIENNEDKREC
uniref:NR LBD domain-containing protein n=1 Tax=Caenorhabditis tropicalis TaxID=1561998 RepID=A0A1I7U2Z9_9PELO